MDIKLVLLLTLSLSNCATYSLNKDTKISNETHGVLMLGVHLNGVMKSLLTGKPRVYLSIRKKAKPKDITVVNFLEANGDYSVIMIDLPSGVYQLGYANFNASHNAPIFQKIKCLGSFKVLNGKISYIGDLTIQIGRLDWGFFASDQHYSYGLFDNKKETLKQARNDFDWLLAEYEVIDSVTSPNTCKDKND